MQREHVLRTPVRSGRPSRSVFIRRRFAVAFALVAIATGIRAATAAANTPQRVLTISARPGDTLWTLWQRYGGKTDPRHWIYTVEQMNGLADDGLSVGQGLRLPVP